MLTIVALYIGNNYIPNISSIFKAETNQIDFKWWYIIPGCIGWFFVMFLPYSIYKGGAAKVFIILVAVQIVASIGWDALIEKMHIGPMKYVSGALAILAALTSIYAK